MKRVNSKTKTKLCMHIENTNKMKMKFYKEENTKRERERNSMIDNCLFTITHVWHVGCDLKNESNFTFPCGCNSKRWMQFENYVSIAIQNGI